MKGKQRTIKDSISLPGVGLFTGEGALLTLKPAPSDTGIIFKRVDLSEDIEIPAKLEFVKETPRCTIMGNNGVTVLTVEHLLSALYAFGIDNIFIEIDGPEIPVGDGSSRLFVDLIKRAGIREFEKEREVIGIDEPVHFSNEDVHIIALPSREFKISYLLHYPESKLLKSQYYSLVVDEGRYIEEIASCRTFSIYEEVEPLLTRGVIKGGGLNNAVIIKNNKILNPEGVRFKEEMARHKILDLIGDLSLIGAKLNMHVIAIRSGHASNISFAKKLLNRLREVVNG